MGDNSNDSNDEKSKARVPAGRVERMFRFGAMAGSLAVGAVTEGAKRIASGEMPVSADFVLTPAAAETLVKHLSEMRGAAMKLGQILSLEGDIGLPPAFSEVLSVLGDAGTNMPTPQLHETISREYGEDWRSRFREFGEEPFASASIGQVHRAVTTDGRELALKIQFPGVAKSIDSDVDNLAGILKMARLLPANLDLKPQLAEVKRQLRAETDYLREARNIKRYANYVADDDSYVVPAVHDDFTTDHVLALDFVDARALSELWTGVYPQKRRNQVATSLQRLVLREIFEFGFMQSDPNYGNYLFAPREKKLALLDFGATIEISTETADCYRELSRACIDEDRRRIRDTIHAFGILSANESKHRVDGFVDLLLLCSEPFRTKGLYDFAASDLPQRIRACGIDLAFKRGLVEPPPPKMIFINRKLGGTYMVSAQLRATADAAALITPYLD